MIRRTIRVSVVGVLAALVLGFSAACGNAVRDYIGEHYQLQRTEGDTKIYTSKDPVGTTTTDIAAAKSPAARQADGGNEYLRYNDDIVIVSPASGGGSTVRVEDIDGGYRGGAFIFLGPGFNPGSPAGGAGGSGGSGSAK